MSEINKLRTRLKNIQRNVTEYRMTVEEAKNLLSEVDELLKPKEAAVQEEVVAPVTTFRILDGGSF
jgi:hypothetical protein